MAFEYLPGESFFHRLDPRTKLVFAALVMVLAVWFTDPFWLAALFASELAILLHSGIPRPALFGPIRAITPVVIVYAIFNLLLPPITISSTTYLFRLIVPISLEAVVWMIGAAIRFYIIITVVRAILILTPLRDIILSLVKFRFPPEFALALTTGLGFFPVLIDENQRIREALASRGWRYEFRNPVKRFKALMTVMFIPAIANSMKRSQDIAIAIDSKGFGYNIRSRTYVRELKLGKRDYAFLAVLTAVFAIAVYGRWASSWATYATTVSLLKLLFFP